VRRDEPHWSLARNVSIYNGRQIPMNPFCAYDCDKYLSERRQGCSARRAFALANGWSFYSNEQPVHTGPAGAGGRVRSQLCGQLVNVVTVREPYSHMVSLANELQLAYLNEAVRKHVLGRTNNVWDYSLLQEYAPAVVSRLGHG
jgi:hypothetical protein